MKKVLLSLLFIILALGLLGAAGYAGYRYGFTQGMITASNAANGNGQFVFPRFGIGPRGMPMHNFGNQRDFDRRGFGMMGRGGFGFGFRLFPLLGLMMWLLFFGLIGAGIYWLISRSGWRLTRTVPVAATPTVTPAPVVQTPPPASNEETTDEPPADS